MSLNFKTFVNLKRLTHKILPKNRSRPINEYSNELKEKYDIYKPTKSFIFELFKLS